MKGSLQGPRGTQDILPQESIKWRELEKKFLTASEKYGFREIRFPTFEYTELFLRGVGDTTDVVEKEMYTFLDKGERSITLKPEGTSSVVRGAIESGILYEALPLKLSYITSCFRYDKPQAGRLREFHQFGLECFGGEDAIADGELIGFAYDFIQSLGIFSFKLEINSIGCSECRPVFYEKLTTHFNKQKEMLCKDCLGRLDKNPLRILDCKEERCQNAVKEVDLSHDYLCHSCAPHFIQLQEQLDLQEISYEINPKIVRGLDYYSKTVFEFTTTRLGAQSTICGGGRYDKLVEYLGGKPTPAVGLAMGVERIILLLEKEGTPLLPMDTIDLYIVTLDEESKKYGIKLGQKLRRNGQKVEYDFMGRSLKAQMKYANKIGAKFTVVIGEKEREEQEVSLKNMKTGQVYEISIDSIQEVIQKGV